MSSASEPNILELNNVSYSYRKQYPLISNISLSVGQGEFIGLLGANGSGKSTILKLEAAYSGRTQARHCSGQNPCTHTSTGTGQS